MILLIDIHGLAYRVAHKLKLSSGGVPTNITYGVLRSIESLCATHDPTRVVICWDGGKQIRQHLYPDYKANRKRDPEFTKQFEAQISVLQSLFCSFPVTQIHQPGIEADDVIALLCRYLKEKQIGIVTGDKDLYQLITDKHRIIDLAGNPVIPEFDRPSQYVTYKVLVGDQSDNIKGVLGLGDKTARRLIDQHKTLRRIMRHAKRTGEKLGRMAYEEALPIVRRNLVLMRLDRDEILTAEQGQWILDSYNSAEPKLNEDSIRESFRQLGFKGTLKRFDSFVVPFRRLAGRRSKIVRAAKKQNEQRKSEQDKWEQESDLDSKRLQVKLLLSCIESDTEWVRQQPTKTLKRLKRILKKLEDSEMVCAANLLSSEEVEFVYQTAYRQSTNLPEWMEA